MKASSIDTGSTSGVSFDIRPRTSRPTRAYFSMSGRTTVACGQRRRASNIGIAERHAERARHVAGGEHDAALAAADDDRLVGERRVVPLLDGGVERVAVHVRDGERVDLRMAQQARASRTPRSGAARSGASWRQSRQKPGIVLAGYRRRGGAFMARRAPNGRRRAPRLPALPRRGRSPARRRKRCSNGSSPVRWSSTPTRNCGSRAAARIEFGTDSGYAPESARAAPGRQR